MADAVDRSESEDTGWPFEGAASLEAQATQSEAKQDEVQQEITKVTMEALSAPLNHNIQQDTTQFQMYLKKSEEVMKSYQRPKRGEELLVHANGLPNIRPSKVILDKLQSNFSLLPAEPRKRAVAAPSVKGKGVGKSSAKMNTKPPTPERENLPVDPGHDQPNTVPIPMEVDHEEELDYEPEAPPAVVGPAEEEYDPVKEKIKHPGQQPYDPSQEITSTGDSSEEEEETILTLTAEGDFYEPPNETDLPGGRVPSPPKTPYPPHLAKKKQIHLKPEDLGPEDWAAIERYRASLRKRITPPAAEQSEAEQPPGQEENATSSPEIILVEERKQEPEVTILEPEETTARGRPDKRRHHNDRPNHAYNARAEQASSHSPRDDSWKRSRPSTSGRRFSRSRSRSPPRRSHSPRQSPKNENISNILHSLLGHTRPGIEKALEVMPAIRPNCIVWNNGHKSFVPGSLPFPPRPKKTEGIYEYITAGFNVPTYLALMSAYLMREGFTVDETVYSHLKSEVRQRLDYFIPAWWRDNQYIGDIKCCWVCGSENHDRSQCASKYKITRDGYCKYCEDGKGKYIEKPPPRTLFHTVVTCPDLHAYCYGCEVFGHQHLRPCPKTEEEKEEDETRWNAFKCKGQGTKHALFTYKQDYQVIFDQVEEIFGAEYADLLYWGKTAKYCHARIIHKDHKENLKRAEEEAKKAEEEAKKAEEDRKQALPRSFAEIRDSIENMVVPEAETPEYVQQRDEELARELEDVQCPPALAQFLTKKLAAYRKENVNTMHMLVKEMFRVQADRMETKMRNHSEALMIEVNHFIERFKSWEARATMLEGQGKEIQDLKVEMDEIQKDLIGFNATVEGFHQDFRLENNNAAQIRLEFQQDQEARNRDRRYMTEERHRLERDRRDNEDLRHQMRREQEQRRDVPSSYSTKKAKQAIETLYKESKREFPSLWRGGDW